VHLKATRPGLAVEHGDGAEVGVRADPELPGAGSPTSVSGG
jgi:hypothetical protein